MRTIFGTHKTLNLKIMAHVIQITSREFRDKQKDYFDLADQGTQIILKRGRKQAYVLTPIDDKDLYLSPEMQEKINKGLQDIKEGRTKSYSLEQLKQKMGL